MDADMTFGRMLRQWREHRRMSQLALANTAEISARHLSFLETGRANPSREMIGRLAEGLQIPLRQRNQLLSLSGYAQVYPQRRLDDPALESAESVLRAVLHGHAPNPALVIDHRWNILAANGPMDTLLRGVDRTLLQGERNAIRLALHPRGLAPAILNYPEWRANAISKLRQRIEATADPDLSALLKEVLDYPSAENPPAARDSSAERNDFALTLQLATEHGVLDLISTTMVFGNPRDVTVSELAIECFFPRDAQSAAVLRKLSQQ